MVWMGDEYYPLLSWYPSRFSDDPEEQHYFAFVDDVAPMSNAVPIDAPDGGILKTANPVLEQRPVRFRMSGIEVRHFLETMGEFEELDEAQITLAQRQQRREQLIAFYDGAAVPVIDVYASPKQEAFDLMRRTLVPSSWHYVIFRQGGEAVADQPVFLGEPYAQYPREFAPGELQALLRVPWNIEARLRDVFSLNHVPDAEIDERDIDDGSAAPTPPPDDDPTGSEPAAIVPGSEHGIRYVSPDPLEAAVTNPNQDDDGEDEFLTQSP